MAKRIQKITLGNLAGRTLNFGFVGENKHTQVIINCAEIFWDYPDATWYVVVRPPMGDLYTVTLTKSDSNLVWDITGSDLIYAGSGQFQLTFTNSGEIIKSVIGGYNISRSLEATGDAPTPIQNWIDTSNAIAHGIAATAALDAVTEAVGSAESIMIHEAATGAVASFDDGAGDVPAKKMEVRMTPMQDFNGYDHAWGGGLGKNILPPSSGDTERDGLTYTVSADGIITVNGTASAESTFTFANKTRLIEAGWLRYVGKEIIVNGCPSGGSDSTYDISVARIMSDSNFAYDYGSGCTFTLKDFSSETGTIYLRVRIRNGVTCNNLVFKPMARFSSDTDDTFVPYANVCPITGRDEITVKRLGKNLIDIADTDKGYLTQTGAYTSSSDYRTTKFIRINPGTTYTYSGYHATTDSVTKRIHLYDADKRWLSQIGTVSVSAVGAFSHTFTATQNAEYVRISMSKIDKDNYNQLEAGGAATAFEPFVYTRSKNLLDVSSLTWTMNKGRDDNGTEVSSNVSKYSSAFPVAPGTEYTLSGTLIDNDTGFRLYFLNNTAGWISRTSAVTSGDSYTFTTPANCGYMQLQVANGLTLEDVQLEYGELATAFEAYKDNTYQIEFPEDAGTVYGGILDVKSDGSAKLSVNWVKLMIADNVGSAIATGYGSSGKNIFTINATDRKYGNMSSNPPTVYSTDYEFKGHGTTSALYSSSTCLLNRTGTFGGQSTSVNMRFRDDRFVSDTDYPTDSAKIAAFKSANANGYIVYCLSNPTVFRFTAEQVRTLEGGNNFSADTGYVTIEYVANTKMYVNKLLQPTEDDMVADHNIQSGKFFMIGSGLYLSTASIASGESIIPGTNCTALSLADALNELNS